MKLEVLISCMNQSDLSIAKRSKVSSDALIINQCDDDRMDEIRLNGRVIRMISTKERGISKSRNMAIANARGDICLFCDNDEVFRKSYEKKITGAFRDLPDADLIVFKVANHACRLKNRVLKLSGLQFLKVTSFQIAFRRTEILSRGVRFDELMGAGSGNGSLEENKFLFDCEKAGLTIYYVPLIIAALVPGDSTWFFGFSENFFYQRGIATRYVLGLPVSVFYAAYYLVRKYPLYRQEISPRNAARCIFRGIRDDTINRRKAAGEQGY